MKLDKEKHKEEDKTYELYRVKDDKVIYKVRCSDGAKAVEIYYKFRLDNPNKDLPDEYEYVNMDEYLWIVIYD